LFSIDPVIIHHSLFIFVFIWNHLTETLIWLIYYLFTRKHRIYNIHYIKLHFSVVHSSIAIEILHISDLILRFYVFIHFAYELFPFRRFKCRRGSNSNVIHNKFEYYFLIICRYLKLVKNMRGILFFSTWNIHQSLQQ
jgi:hypothetical protein